MISPDYCLMMARYNAWQNKQLKACLRALFPADLALDRGAFFGSILGTLNHLMWGDQLWMARFDGGAAPIGGIAESTALTASLPIWETERFQTDARILLWAEGLKSIALTGNMTWHSGAVGRDVTKPVALCVTHMFNHQTHHRGQVHAMLTSAGVSAPTSDLPLMPKEGPWL